MIFGPRKNKRFSRWPSVELKCSHMFLAKKLSVRRRLFVFTVALLLTFSLFVLVIQSNVINYASKSVRQLIESINNDQVILNEETFGPATNASIVIVVQVHKRVAYLRHLIFSLSQTQDISKSLIIFSHDFYDEEINSLVRGINFCKVMQIFYPFSIQIFANEFPGDDPKDCDRNMNKFQALLTDCQNAHYPDLYGHYREAVFTQMKHHWWWKLNRIFDQLEVTKRHSGLLLLLEEDYYVAPDFLHVLNQLESTSTGLCPHCNILSLGTYNEAITSRNFDKVEITPWITSKHNMGMALNRATWSSIKSCAKYFCDYDDYNYDWSLQNINYKCLKEKLNTMIITGPRVHHIGECGMHHTKNDCDQLITKVQRQLQSASLSGHLFPKSLKLAKTSVFDEVSDTLKPNGGWADLRDILLCLNMTLQG